MRHYNVKPIQLTLRPSSVLAALLAAVILGACLIVLCMPAHLTLKLGVCLFIIAIGAYAIAQHAWLALPWSCCGLELNAQGELQLLRKDGKRLTVTVSPASYIGAYLTVVNLTEAKAIRSRSWRQTSLILTPDRVDAEQFRRLRVWLRWGRHDWHTQVRPEEVS